MKPNIFSFATRELSQDGFFAWLFQWADERCYSHNTVLGECARDLILNLIQKQMPDYRPQIHSVEPERQWEGIDICLDVNSEVLIVIEDKTASREHSDQLNRYRAAATGWCKNNQRQIVCVYLTTGSEPNSALDAIGKKGFAVFSRSNVLSILRRHPNSGSDIYSDYVEHIENIETSEQGYVTRKIKDWDWQCWTGFYRFLDDNLHLISWGYVPNPSGGFLNAAINWLYWGRFPVYIQIEQGPLCFKICTDPDEVGEIALDRSEIRAKWHACLLSCAKEYHLPEIHRPDRFGKGVYMTVALIERATWLGSDDAILEPGDVLKRIQSYAKFLATAIRQTQTEAP